MNALAKQPFAILLRNRSDTNRAVAWRLRKCRTMQATSRIPRRMPCLTRRLLRIPPRPHSVSDGPPIFDAPRTFPESNASHIAGDGNIDWTATVGRAHLEFASTSDASCCYVQRRFIVVAARPDARFGLDAKSGPLSLCRLGATIVPRARLAPDKPPPAPLAPQSDPRPRAADAKTPALPRSRFCYFPQRRRRPC